MLNIKEKRINHRPVLSTNRYLVFIATNNVNIANDKTMYEIPFATDIYSTTANSSNNTFKDKLPFDLKKAHISSRLLSLSVRRHPLFKMPFIVFSTRALSSLERPIANIKRARYNRTRTILQKGGIKFKNRQHGTKRADITRQGK